MTSTDEKVLEIEGAKKSVDGRITRRRYGATGHGYLIDGVKADGVTGILDGSMPKKALIGWAAGNVASFVYDDPEQTLQMAKRLGKDAFVKAMKELPTQDRDLAAKRGTEVHKLAELAARGEEVDVPNELAGHFDAYMDFRLRHQPRNEMLEVVVAHLKYRYGGTLDAWAHLPMLKGMMVEYPGGQRKVFCNHDYECLTLVDTKTSRSGVYSETGLQTAAYGYATHYIDAAGNVREMVKIDHYVSLWLRSDGWDLIPFDVTEKDWKIFLYCQQVARFTDWKKGRSATIKGEALPLPPLPDLDEVA